VAAISLKEKPAIDINRHMGDEITLFCGKMVAGYDRFLLWSSVGGDSLDQKTRYVLYMSLILLGTGGAF
jgi:hypothetical protein